MLCIVENKSSNCWFHIGVFSQILYDKGARKFAIAGVPALGCLPAVLAATNVSEESPSCSVELNSIATLHNSALERSISRFVQRSDGANVVYVNVEAFFSNVTNNPQDFGFDVGFGACCGGGRFNGEIQCGRNNTSVCRNHDSHVFWDAFHPSQKVGYLLAKEFFSDNLTFVSPCNLPTLATL